MAATTLQQIADLATNIRADFAAYTFRMGDDFYWSPETLTITHTRLRRIQDIWSLLHEIAHAELTHHTFDADVELIHQEAAAWEFAQQRLAPQYLAAIDDDYIQDHLDTYRRWLHSRSLCPTCGHTGLQTTNTYSCMNCRCLWRANFARGCALRRIKLPT